MNFAPKLTIGLGSLACLTIVVGYAGILTTGHFQERYRQVIEESIPALNALHNLRSGGLELVAGTTEAVLFSAEMPEAGFYEGAEIKAEIGRLGSEASRELDLAMAEYRQSASLHPEEQSLLTAIDFGFERLKKISAEIIEMKLGGQAGAGVLVAAKEFETAESAFLQAIDKAMARKMESLEKQRKETAGAGATGLATIKTASLSIFLLAIGLGIFIIRKLRHLPGKMAGPTRGSDCRRINQELDQLAYVLSHDLKAPLEAIADLARSVEEDGEAPRERMEALRSKAAGMEALIDSLLEYSRIGRMEEAREKVEVLSLLKETIDSISVPPGFRIEIDPNMPTVNASRTRMHQVFANLLGNAIKYNDRKKGSVRISARGGEDFHEFSVIDNGPGIAPPFQGKIFEIFQTLAPEGRGVGLTLVKKIVEENGGTITLESEEGRGAAFRFTWPK